MSWARPCRILIWKKRGPFVYLCDSAIDLSLFNRWIQCNEISSMLNIIFVLILQSPPYFWYPVLWFISSFPSWKSEFTTLIIASSKGFTKIVQLLLEAGANTEARSAVSWSFASYLILKTFTVFPLMRASLWFHHQLGNAYYVAKLVRQNRWYLKPNLHYVHSFSLAARRFTKLQNTVIPPSSSSFWKQALIQRPTKVCWCVIHLGNLIYS